MGPTKFRRRGIHRLSRVIAGALLATAIGSLVAFAGEAAAAASQAPAISITPSANSGKFNDGQIVRVSVGPNSLFIPHSRVVIIQCADPGGDTSHLPVSLGTCDENTVQGDTTVVQADGSFIEPSYTMFSLPNKVLGEQANAQPVCNLSSECVLFVGEDQNDFTKPKLFSQAFFMTAGSGSTSTVVPTAPAAPSTPATAVNAAVSLSPTNLAFTGSQEWLFPLAGSGALLFVLGLAGARVARRSAR
jgi:hypothetical protein